MTKFSIGDIVASEMNTILDSEEHTRLFSKTAKKEEKEDKDEEKEDKKSKKKDEKSDKKSDKKDEKSDKKSDKKDDKDEKEDKKSKKSESDKEDKGDKKAKKDKGKEKEDKKSEKKEMTSKSFEKLVNIFTKVSHLLDESGLVNSSVITLEALDSVIEEMAVLKFAKEKCCDCDKCGKDCPCEKCSDCECMDCMSADDTNDVKAIEVLRPTVSDDKPVGSLYDEIAELEGDPGTALVEDLLTDPEAVQSLNAKRNDERLADELGKPDYLPFSMVEGEPLEADDDLNDAALLEELGLSPLDDDPELSGVVSQKYRDAENEILGGGVASSEEDAPLSELDKLQFGDTEIPKESVIEDIELPGPPKTPLFADEYSQKQLDKDRVEGLDASKQDLATIRPGSKFDPFEEEDVKSAFDKLDNWITKHAQTMLDDDSDPGFTYESGNDPVRKPGGEWMDFSNLSPEERLEHEMGAGLHEQLDVDPDKLSYEDLGDPEEEDEDFWPKHHNHDYDDVDDAEDEDFEDE
ncbi:MAG TPA: hypothetical protein VM577_14175 [Anaerovoracaceae bacterium]|nr:hypothetical protein [Anaerovoracaceae bacterium]